MAPLVVDNGTLLTLNGVWTNGLAMDNVMFYHREENDPHDAALDVMNNWQDHIVPLFLNNYSFLGINYVDLNSADGVTGFIPYDSAKPHQGGGSSEGLPPAVCVLVKKLIESRRGARTGRIYMGPCQENQADENGVIISGTIADYNTAFAAFHSGTTDSAGYLAVLHQPAGESPSWSQITGYATDSKLAVQRRRMGR